MKKTNKTSVHRSSARKVSLALYRKAINGSKVLAALRQLRHKKPFRIPAPFWSLELIKAMEKEATEILTGADHLGAKPERMASTETKVLLLLLVDFATGLWRIRKKILLDNDEPTEQMRPIYRHVESIWDALVSANVEIHDYTGEKYIAGMALNVIAFQPSSSVKVETIVETVKPSISYKNKLIQRGEVFVETPEVEQADQNSIIKTSDIEGSNINHNRTEPDEKEEPNGANNPANAPNG